MNPVDAVGNLLQHGDLVNVPLEHGGTMLGVVVQVREATATQLGYIKVAPLVLDFVFKHDSPRINICKMVKPPNFNTPVT